MSRGGITLRKFEPIKPEKEVISLRLDTRMLQEINDWAMEIDISRNEFINQCIDFALKNIDTELIEQVERRHNGRGGISRRLRTGFEDDEKEKDEEWLFPRLFLNHVCFFYIVYDFLSIWISFL